MSLLRPIGELRLQGIRHMKIWRNRASGAPSETYLQSAKAVGARSWWEHSTGNFKGLLEAELLGTTVLMELPIPSWVLPPRAPLGS